MLPPYDLAKAMGEIQQKAAAQGHRETPVNMAQRIIPENPYYDPRDVVTPKPGQISVEHQKQMTDKKPIAGRISDLQALRSSNTKEPTYRHNFA